VRRMGMILATAVAFAWWTAGIAFASSTYPPSVSPPTPAPTSPGSIAFTGGNISLGLVILASLLVAGALLLLAGRRRQPRVAR
jgi:hypothetical protein